MITEQAVQDFGLHLFIKCLIQCHMTAFNPIRMLIIDATYILCIYYLLLLPVSSLVSSFLSRWSLLLSVLIDNDIVLKVQQVKHRVSKKVCYCDKLPIVGIVSKLFSLHNIFLLDKHNCCITIEQSRS